MDKNQIRGSPFRTSELVFTKSISIKGIGCKSGIIRNIWFYPYSVATLNK